MDKYEAYDTTVVKGNSDSAPTLAESSGPAVRTTQWRHMAVSPVGGTNYFVACVALLLAPLIKGDTTNSAYATYVHRTKMARRSTDMVMTTKAMVRPDSPKPSFALRRPPAKGGGWILKVAL